MEQENVCSVSHTGAGTCPSDALPVALAGTLLKSRVASPQNRGSSVGIWCHRWQVNPQCHGAGPSSILRTQLLRTQDLFFPQD